MTVHAALNWLWQGCLIAVALAAMLRVLGNARAQVRYGVCAAGAVLVLLLPLLPVAGAAGGPVPVPAAGAAPVPILSVPQAWWTSSVMLMMLWGGWTAIGGARFLAALVALRRARTGSRPFPAAVERNLTHWNRVRTDGREATLVVSERVRAAAVLGGAAPVIAVAPALVRQLDADELDRIIVHEWAHVQRRDDLANLLQVAGRAVAGWHPAVWWIDRRLQIERELACDERAVAITGSAKSYAACLVKLADLPLARQTLPVPGVLSSALGVRVRRLVARRDFAPQGRSHGVAAAVVVLLAALALASARFQVVEAALALPMVAAPRASAEPWPAATTSIDPPRPARAPAQPARTPEARGASAAAAPQVAPPAAPAAPPPAPVAPLAASAISAAAAVAPVPPAVGAASSGDGRETVTPSPWNGAAAAGLAVGRESTRAGLATAGFFNRFAQRVAGSF